MGRAERIAFVILVLTVFGGFGFVNGRMALLERRVQVAEARATLAFRAVEQCATTADLAQSDAVAAQHLGILASHNRRIRAFELEYPLKTGAVHRH